MSVGKVIRAKAQHTRCNFDATLLRATCCMQHFHVTLTCNILHFDPKWQMYSCLWGACGVVIALLLKKQSRRHSRNRKVWVREWVKNRQRFGTYHQLVQELRLADS